MEKDIAMTTCQTTTALASSARSASKRSMVGPLRLFLGLSTALTPLSAFAENLPTGGVVTHGEATITTPNSTNLLINQGSNTAVVDWNGFSIGQGNTVTIDQPSSNASILNRVTGDATSQIHGSLNANGQVYVVNPNGIFIGKTGSVNAGGFVASTLGIRTEDFVLGKPVFEGNGNSATVTNEGTIDIVTGGYAALLGGKISNSGIIRAPLGKVGLGAGERATLDFTGDGFLQVAIPSDSDDDGLEALIEQSGTIQADGGQVHIQAATARNAVRNAINLTGVVEARTVSGRNGAITLGGGGGGKVRVTGRVRTSPRIVVTQSPRPPALPMRGGDITITGNQITLEGATLDASGEAGGGSIRVGGNYQGGAGLQTASMVDIDTATFLLADAGQTGDGGRIIVWSDIHTDFAGQISTQGGSESGNGGFVEVSGKQTLQYSGHTDTRAENGEWGTLLLDPLNITVSDTGGGSTSNVIAAGTLSTELESTSIILDTSSFSGIEDGDISILSPLSWGSNSRLTLLADRNISIAADITAADGRLTLDAQNNITATAGINVGRFALDGGDWSQISATLPGFTTTDFSVSPSASFLRAIGGTGVAGDPFQLTDIYGVQGIGTGSLLFNDFVLSNDIDASATNGWNTLNDTFPLGTDGEGFNPISSLEGDLDGAGFAIDGLFVERSLEHGGLIDTIELGVVVQDLTFTNSNLAGQSGGALAGINLGSIENVTVTDGTVFSVAFDAGGLVAENFGTISDSFSSAGVRTRLDGLNPDSGTADYALGGLVGFNEAGAVIQRSRATGDVLQQVGPAVSAGGLVGLNEGTILSSVATAPDVTIREVQSGSVGGLVGLNQFGALIQFSFSDIGLVDSIETGGSPTDTLQIGGLVGNNFGTIADSYSLTDVTSRNAVSSVVGGLVGVNQGDVTRSFSTGVVASTVVGSSTGGLIGLIDSGSTTTASYWDTVTSGQATSADGTGLTTAQLQDTSGFLTLAEADGWNFDATWAPGDTGDYASLYRTSPVVFVRGDSDSFEYTGSTSVFTFTAATLGGASDFVFGEEGETLDTSVLISNAELSSPNVGSQTVTFPDTSLTASLGTTYRVVTVDADVEITPAPLQITADDQTKVYGDTFSFDGDEFTVVGLLASDTVTSADLSSAAEAPTAEISSDGEGGSYTIAVENADGTGLANYDISFVSGTFTVDQAPLTITADDASKVYATRLDFDGSEFQSAGLLNGDVITSVDLFSLGSPVTATVTDGPYAIVASDAVGPRLENYDITFVDGTLPVTPASLELRIFDQTKVYGTEFVFDDTEFTPVGLRNDDSITSASLASEGAAATATVDGAPYAITGSNAVGSGLGNYTLSFVDGSFDVTPAPLLVTADSLSKVYGVDLTFNGTEFTAAGFANGDTLDSVDLASDGAAATAQVLDGPFVITADNAQGAAASNYDITFDTGTLTVTPAPLTITAQDQSKVYATSLTFDGSEFIAEGLANGDTITSVDLFSEGSPVTATVADGPYAIVASTAVSPQLDNYDVAFVDGALTVTPAPLELRIFDQTKVYGTEFDFVGTEFTPVGLRNGDSVTSADLISEGAGATATVDGAPYAITGENVQGTGISNYTIISVDGAFEVTPAQLEITARDLTKVYGEEVTFEGTEFLAPGLLNGDIIASVDLASDGAVATAQVADGPFVITAGNAQGAATTNYDITFGEGQLSVDLAQLTITANDQRKLLGTEFVFDGTEFTVVGLLNDDEVLSGVLSSNGAGIDATVEDNPHAINVTDVQGTGLANYDLAAGVPAGVLIVFEQDIVPPVTNPIPPFGTGSLPNPPDDLTQLVLNTADQLGGSRGIQQSGTTSLTRATETFQSVDEAANAFESKVSNCDSSVRGFGSYVNCLAESLDSFSDALDGLEKDLPRGLENVSAIVDNARNGVRAAGSRATRRLATATTDAQRRAIQAEAVAEARGAIDTAKAEIRKSISLIRAEDPDLVRVQRQTVSRIVTAFDTVETKLVRAVQL